MQKTRILVFLIGGFILFALIMYSNLFDPYNSNNVFEFTNEMYFFAPFMAVPLLLIYIISFLRAYQRIISKRQFERKREKTDLVYSEISIRPKCRMNYFDSIMLFLNLILLVGICINIDLIVSQHNAFIKIICALMIFVCALNICVCLPTKLLLEKKQEWIFKENSIECVNVSKGERYFELNYSDIDTVIFEYNSDGRGNIYFNKEISPLWFLLRLIQRKAGNAQIIFDVDNVMEKMQQLDEIFPLEVDFVYRSVKIGVAHFTK